MALPGRVLRPCPGPLLGAKMGSDGGGQETAMRALVVHESMFGNTAAVAAAVARGLRMAGFDEVEVVEVGSAPRPLPPDVDLLVVGAPTHALGLSRPETRASARDQASGPLVSRGIGVREWLAGLEPGSRPVATFDTHIDKPIPGTASRAAHKRLRRLGYRPVVPAESFAVSDVAGPLVAGELERAERWGTAVAAATFVGVR